MFQLKFTPNFARQKREFLAEKKVLPIALPSAVEACIASIGQTEFTYPSRKVQVGKLWVDSFNVISRLIWKAAGISFLAAAAAAASTLAAMQILKPGQSLQLLFGFSVLYFVMNSLSQWGILSGSRMRTWVGLGVESHLVSLISKKLLQLSSSAAAQQSSGNLKVLITSDVRNVGQFFDNLVRNLIPAISALIVIGPLIYHFSGKAGLFGLLVMASILPIALGLNQISMHYQKQSQTRLDELTTLVGEWVKNIRLIRYLGWDVFFQKDVSQGLRRFMTSSVLQHWMACLIFGLGVSWWMVSITGVVVVAKVFQYPFDLVGFFGSLWLMTFLGNYFTHLPNVVRLYGQAAPSMDRIAKLLAQEELADSFKKDDQAPLRDVVPRSLIFENVSFAYPDGKRAIDQLSLKIEVNRKIAVIGEITSGKSTLLKLLCGQIPPTIGRILVEFNDGTSRDLWTESTYHHWRSSLAWVPQEPFVSSDLLSANISLNAEPSNDESSEILDAAYWAELETDLAALPQGMRQEIGESGVNLSGGQRQRLNLARAKFTGRNFFVLDDTLSAVDKKTEVKLMGKLMELDAGFILVTHRTGELMQVEEVIVLEAGRVTEQGRPHELVARADSHFLKVLRAYEGMDTHV